MLPKRMTANPVKPSRYRPGKAFAEEHSSDSESGEEEDDETSKSIPEPSRTTAAPPKAASFPSSTISTNLKKVDLNERKKEAAAKEVARLEQEAQAKAKEEEGFETESSAASAKSDSGSSESEAESEEESSSEDEAPQPKLLRPVFLKKGQRQPSIAAANAKSEEEAYAEAEAQRKEKMDALVQEQLEKDAAAKAAGKKAWDDDDEGLADEIDDTDGVDAEAERAAWRLRELRRVKREREAIELAEKELEEVERRKNLTAAEREAEDREYIEKQKAEREGRGQMGFMQKYHHRGAFFQDDDVAQELAKRDIVGARFVDDPMNRDTLPQYMQIRDMTKLGKKGGTKYRDLKSEDTGRWGEFGDRRGPRENGYGVDERFRPDRDRERTGANAGPLGERKRSWDTPGGQQDMRESKRQKT
ncbi:splicing factor, Prp19-binding domain-containing protein [Cryomyces antarcticus]|nr:hypothetical protein LTR39_001243 [Cryomyces antarcticus]KAK5142626.1 hypothetical protein LTR04_002165 [Oleoguttula sp. CCFEE 6159]